MSDELEMLSNEELLDVREGELRRLKEELAQAKSDARSWRGEVSQLRDIVANKVRALRQIEELANRVGGGARAWEEVAAIAFRATAL